MKERDDVYVDGYNSDNAGGITYEATCPVYPELVGIGDTVDNAYLDLKKQIAWHVKVGYFEIVRIH